MIALLASAWVVDQLVGEWPAALHPVVWVGKLVSFLERLAVFERPAALFAFGVLIAFGVPTLLTWAVVALMRATEFAPWVHFALGVYILKSTFALRALGEASERVATPLRENHIEEARLGLSHLCSRDAQTLERHELSGAAIESVAENASDSVVAPLMYAAIFGVGGAVFYRVVNTLDAMIGYPTGRYAFLGKASARLDDVLNWIPARLTAAALLVSGALFGGSFHNGWRVLRRDGAKTRSPNAGRPMAAMAGLLGVELDKRGEYSLGAPGAAADVEDIDRAWRITWWACAGFFGVVCAALGVASV